MRPGDEAVAALAQFVRAEATSSRDWYSLEVVVTETPAELRNVMRPDLGITLIDLDQSES